MYIALMPTALAQSVSSSDFVAFARQNCIGIPYVKGGRSTKGFDCCGLVWYVCNHFGISVGSGDQNSQRNYGTAVSYSLSSYDAYLRNLKEGDLIFFDYQGDGKSDHVGIYSGNGMIIQAHKEGTNSKEDKLSGIWRDNKAEWKFTCSVRRVLNSATVKTYTISYNANGGIGAPSPQTKQHDVPLTISNIVPSRAMYTFIGWAPLPNATEPTGWPGGITNVNQDITFYALWKPNTYTITYDANGGTGAPPVQSFVYNSGAKFSTDIPVKVGYTFINWKDDWDGNFYNPGDPIPSGWGANTLRAQWKANPDSPTPAVTPSKPVVTARDIGSKVHLEWNACSNADYYDVRIFDENEQQILMQYGVYATSFDYPLSAGTYHASVAAVNNNTNCMFSDYVYFTIAEHKHTYGAWSTVTAATCTTAGTERRTCSCGAEEQRSVNALGHNYSTEWTVDIPATKTTTGSKSHHCTRCSAKTDVTVIPATGAQNVTKTFKDVIPGSWYEDAVQYAVEHNLFSGTSPTEFAPNVMMTRAMLVTVLWRMEGKPTASAENPFTDVPSGQWYTDAVTWAAANGIVYRITDDTFEPMGNITREQMATILHRYAEKKGYDVTKSEDLNAFPDGAKTSDYAADALSWAYAEKLITGVKSGNTDYLDPKGGATRAQVASILMRYGQNIANVK